MVQIKRNEYVEPTQIRESVVQDICDAFLSKCCWNVFHPVSDGNYRRPTLHVLKSLDNKAYGFDCSRSTGEVSDIRIRTCEMKEAFKLLQEAGYYMFKVFEYGTWFGYRCYNKPYLEDGKRVTTFDHFID